MTTKTVGNIPQRLDLQVYQGDDFFLHVAVSDHQGNPVDLTDVVAVAQIRASADATEVLATFDVVVEDSTIHLFLDHDTTASLPSGVWDLQVTDTNSYEGTFLRGCVEVVAEVTRP